MEMLLKTIKSIDKGFQTLVYRYQTQGLRTTGEWFFSRGFTWLTGVPILRNSRVTPQIFVGAQMGRSGLRHLARAGIAGVVNLRNEYDDAARGLTLERYCYLPTVDDEAPSMEHLIQGIAFIQELVSDGMKVYIHCGGGVGRAPTMASAYLISQGMTVEEALALIKQTRPFIKITPPQMERLYVCQKYFHDESSLN